LSFVAAVEELQPERALAENVPDLVRFNGGRQLRDIVRALEDIGYDVDAQTLPARRFGVPQHRERLFIQAVRRGGCISWPKPVAGAADTLMSAIGDLPAVAPGHQEETIPYAPTATPPSWARAGVTEGNEDVLFDHIVRDVREDDLLAFRGLAPGGTYLDIPSELRRYDDENFTDKYKRLEWEKPSRTITAHIARDGYWYIHPEQHRTLSIREAARVQTFPDWFRFAGFPSNRLTQIGNAVPPLLGEAVGRALLRPEDESPSHLPRAIAVLRKVATEEWEPMSAWQVLVREAVFLGRAGDERIERFLSRFPDAATGAQISHPANEHERQAREVASALLDAGGDVPREVEAVHSRFGVTARVARVIVSLVHGGEMPRSSATTRLAERVAGVLKAGSLNGLSQAPLARLCDFGDYPGINQLLLDVARFVCVPETPRCLSCPLADACAYADARGVERDKERRSEEALALF
jgi:DNA (cytosine-5)-methyltransferase 1